MDRPCTSAADQTDSGLLASDGQAEQSGGGLTGANESFGLGDRVAVDPVFRPQPGTRIGDVTIGRLLAAGGMGCVYEGWQDAPRRRVAVKLMQPRGSGRFASRFAREIDVLASLRHPHIAQVYSCGTHRTDAGEVPYYVMELVPEAESITVYAVHHGLSIRERVVLFSKVCAAIAHAHSLGVIHRDLKPANILVGSDGTPKVIDFGVARLVDPSVDGRVDDDRRGLICATRAGELVGTLQYMSPEQIVGGSGVDERTDVYALGLVLHELVTRRPPYDLSGRSYTESVRIVTGNGAATSVAVARAAAADGNGLDARSLGVITSTCLEADASDRYPSAARLEADVIRWLEDRPILARPPTPWESARRFARRHRAVAWSGAVAMAALVIAVVGISLASLRAGRLRHEAEQQATAARQQLYTATVLLAAEARDRDNVVEARRLVDEARQLTGRSEPIELRCLAASLDEASEAMAGAEGTVAAVAWSSDGRWLAAGDATGSVRLHRPGAEGMTAVAIGTHEGAIWSLAVSPDGLRLASAGADGRVRIWNVSTGACEAELTSHESAVYSVAFAPDGATLASASRDRTARLWDTTTWEERRVLREHTGTVYAARFSGDGRRLVTASMDRTARAWNTDTGVCEVTFSGHSSRVFSAAFSADGAAIVTASEDGTARTWNAITGEERHRLAHPFRVNAAVFVGPTARVATAAADDVLRIWEPGSPEPPRRLHGHAGPIWAVASTHDGRRLATGSADGAVRIWDGSGVPANVVAESDRVLAASFSGNGSRLATGLADGSVVLRDAATLTEEGRLSVGGGRVNGVTFLAYSSTVAVAGDDGCVTIWDVATHERQMSIAAHSKRVYSVAVSPDGSHLATAGEDRTARLWNAATGEAIGGPLRHPRRVFCAVFTTDGRRLVTACEDRIVRVWDAADGRELGQWRGHGGPVNWVAASADGEWIASAGSDATIRLWRARDGRPGPVLTGPAKQIWKCAFSPDASRIAGVSADGAVQLWDVASGRPALMLRGHGDQVWAVAFRPDGDALVSGGWDGTTRLWGVSAAEIVRRRLPPVGPSLRDGQPVAEQRAYGSPVTP